MEEQLAYLAAMSEERVQRILSLSPNVIAEDGQLYWQVYCQDGNYRTYSVADLIRRLPSQPQTEEPDTL